MTETAAALLVRALENEGVNIIFGVPGEENLEFLNALQKSRIRFITTRSEQGAAFMADVYGRLSGRAGVCLATLGPGATNLITGVADANLDHAPLVAIAGQAATTRLHKESHQVLDLQALFQPITKYSAQILEPEIIPEVVRKAFKQAESAKPGAAFLELPENIAEQAVCAEPLPRGHHERLRPDFAVLAEVAAILNRAQQPLILAGNGVIRSQASAALAAFAKDTNLPVANTFMAKGVIPFKQAQALGSVGLQAKDYVNTGLDAADVVLCIGYDLVEYHPHLWHPRRDKILLHIDSNRAEIDAHYSPTWSLIGDISLILQELSEKIIPRQDLPTQALRQALIDDMKQHANDADFPVKPQKILWDLRTVLPLDGLLLSDVGAHKLWIARMWRCELPNTCLISNGFASMGIALPGAIAAKLLYPERPVVAICGDGGFLLNLGELETAQRLGLAFVVLVWRDDGYGLIRWKQEKRFGSSSYCDFGNPDVVKLAEAFGAKGFRVKAGDDLQHIIQEALAHPGVAIIDCPVDYSENLRLTQKLGELIAS
jgi:acetolactate synthase-1/2/3 large subunit